MSAPTHPYLSKVKRHFARAKAIRCIDKNIEVDVTGISNFQYNKARNVWTTVGGALLVWTEKNGYAEITRKVCKCKNCKCK